MASSPIDGLQTELLERGEWSGELVQRRRDGERITVASQWSLWKGNGRTAVTEVYTDLTGLGKEHQDADAVPVSRKSRRLNRCHAGAIGSRAGPEKHDQM